jgi:hypothetical protein
MADVDQSVMWGKWMKAVQDQIFPNGLEPSTLFSAGSVATPIDLNDPNPGMTNYGIYSIGDVIPGNSPNYVASPSGLITSYGIFLDWIDLGGDSNPNLESQINLANSAFNAAQTAYTNVVNTAYTQYTTYKTNATAAGETAPPFRTWVITNYPTLAAAQEQLAGAQSKAQQLNTQRYGAGYNQIVQARALIAFSAGGAQDLSVQNPNNMPIVTGPLPPAGSTKVLIGDAPLPQVASAQISSFRRCTHWMRHTGKSTRNGKHPAPKMKTKILLSQSRTRPRTTTTINPVGAPQLVQAIAIGFGQ